MRAEGPKGYRWGIFKARLGLGTGSEQGGVRPVLVISDEDFNRAVPVVTVFPLTSHKPGRKIYPNEVLLAKGVGRLPRSSIVLTHQVRTISKDRLIGLYGFILDETIRGQVLEALRIHLGME
jgi:mRNA interferase MazF